MDCKGLAYCEKDEKICKCPVVFEFEQSIGECCNENNDCICNHDFDSHYGTET